LLFFLTRLEPEPDPIKFGSKYLDSYPTRPESRLMFG
jgi:hypothetical protein